MYYILNERDQIIAADNSLLGLCGVDDINAFIAAVAQGTACFDITSDTSLVLDGKEFTVTKNLLSSLLGTLTIVELSEQLTKDSSTQHIPEDEEDTFALLLDEESENALEETNTQEILPANTIEDTLQKEEILLKTEISHEHTVEIDDREIFDIHSETAERASLALEDDTPVEHTLDEDKIFLDNTENLKEDAIDEIKINIDAISQKIGISAEDYHNFLNEFIDTALTLEKELQDPEKCTNAIQTLKYLGNMLHLPEINDIVSTIEKSDDVSRNKNIESFYTTLSRITTVGDQKELELFDDIEKKEEKTTLSTPKPTSDSFGSIDLSDVKAKHFDFQLEEAANDLSLPVELIEEFVHDFIEQAHIETKNMLKAYEAGDLESIQNIGHLLKGASSNLRITPLAETLYNIQFCEDPNQLEDLIKDYWAHFLSFEHQINVISN